MPVLEILRHDFIHELRLNRLRSMPGCRVIRVLRETVLAAQGARRSWNRAVGSLRHVLGRSGRTQPVAAGSQCHAQVLE